MSNQHASLSSLVTRESILTSTAHISPADHSPKGGFSTHNGKQCAGLHLIVDLQDAEHLDELDLIREALIDAAEASHATVLHVHLHRFGGGAGVSGVVVLAESHFSVHTWPEYGFAALDLFMCGSCNPHHAIPVLQDAFTPREIRVEEILRGAR